MFLIQRYVTIIISHGKGIGDWGLGPIPNPQSPIPNPQSPLYDIKIYNIISSLLK